MICSAVCLVCFMVKPPAQPGARLGPVLTIDAKHHMTPQEWLAFCNAVVIHSPSSSQTG